MLKLLLLSYVVFLKDVLLQTMGLHNDILVTVVKPIKQHAYHILSTLRAVMTEEVKYLHGLAKHSCGPWCSSCLVVPKEDVSYRLFTGYRHVNAVSDSYPLPGIKYCTGNVGSAYFDVEVGLD